MKTRTETYEYDDKGRVTKKTVMETETQDAAPITLPPVSPIWVDPNYWQPRIWCTTTTGTNTSPDSTVTLWN